MITKEVIERLYNDTKETFDFYDKKGLRKSNKQKSEDISGLLETAMADLITGAVAAAGVRNDKSGKTILH